MGSISSSDKPANTTYLKALPENEAHDMQTIKHSHDILEGLLMGGAFLEGHYFNGRFYIGHGNVRGAGDTLCEALHEYVKIRREFIDE